ncbi:hypothetical protein [Saccharopolyspora taberi]|uniref:Cell division protein FtsL n=1 Tax=Saccharopolyspora taberi TaxID=60895 RepID=A0ABN3V7P2_9PSEU
MTAPARTRTTTSRTGTTEREQTEKKKRTRSAAAERAYARREERRDRSLREATERRPRTQRQPGEQRRPQRVGRSAAKLQEKVAGSRASLVVAGMGMLTVGLLATLWLSIAAVSGSYELQQNEARINALNEQKEQLMLEVSALDSTPALQREAERQGLVPAPPPAHLVPNPDGTVTVVGDPQAAEAPKPPAPPVQAPPVQAPPAPPQQAAGAPAVEAR